MAPVPLHGQESLDGVGSAAVRLLQTDQARVLVHVSGNIRPGEVIVDGERIGGGGELGRHLLRL